MTAASRNSPDARGSRPTTARGRCPAKVPASPRTCAAATARSRASSAVRSALAMPRTPSVPNRRPTRELTLAVLRRLARLLQPVLLPLLDPRVAGQEAGLLQRRPVGFGIGFVECPRDAQSQRAGLAGRAAAGHARHDVVRAVELEGPQRLTYQLLVHLVREVVLERPAV